jgi:hypothetical protein
VRFPILEQIFKQAMKTRTNIVATLVPSGTHLNYPESRNIWGKNVLDWT